MVTQENNLCVTIEHCSMQSYRERETDPKDPYRGPWNLDGIGGLLFAILEELSEIRKVLAESVVLDGTSITNTFTLPGGGAKVTKIDFVEARHDGVPNNVSFDVPLKKIARLKITNLGPGNVFYSTNKGLAQYEAAELIEAGETEKIYLKKRSISQLNLVCNNVQGASGQTAKVRVTAWV